MTTAVKERPILFSGEMVRAILDGRKTQTRRVIKPQPPSIDSIRKLSGGGYGWMRCDDWGEPDTFRVTGPVLAVREHGVTIVMKCPYGQPGDRLWVRETWKPSWVALPGISGPGVSYKSDGKALGRVEAGEIQEAHYSRDAKWRPSIHMPRWASRITLEVTDVRVERIQDIGKDGRRARDVLAEGVTQQAIDIEKKWFHPDDCPAIAFSHLWDTVNVKRDGGIYSWEANPWVWAVSFQVMKGGE